MRGQNAPTSDPKQYRAFGEEEFVRRLAGQKPDREIYIWGAGQGGRNAASSLILRKVPFKAFIDRDPAKIGSEVMGHPVVAPAFLKKAIRPLILIGSMYHREISARLRAMGYKPGDDFLALTREGFAGLAAYPLYPAYATWRWGRSSVSMPPLVISVSSGAAWTRESIKLPRRSDEGEERWCCLIDREAHLSTDWYVDIYELLRRNPGLRAFAAGIEVLPPRNALQRRAPRPFLLRWLLLEHLTTPPVFCRVSQLRFYLRANPRNRRTLADFLDWLRNRGELSSVKAPIVAGYSERWARLRLRELAEPDSPIEIHVKQRRSRIAEFSQLVGAEGGIPFSLEEVQSIARDFLPQAAQCGMEYLRGRRKRYGAGRKLGIVAHTRGNSFFLEIQTLLTAAFRRAGINAFSCNQKTLPDSPGTHYLIIAPHEFFILPGIRPEWRLKSSGLSVINTEQPNSRWFSASLPVLLKSPLILDVNWQSCMILRLLGLNAHFLPLGFLPRFQAFAPHRQLPSKTAFAHLSAAERKLRSPVPVLGDRPIDVLFVGSLSPRREELFAGWAKALSKYSCFLHLLSEKRPVVLGSPECMDSRDMADLCARSKILLNVHRDELPYFEWQRMVLQGMWHGALVVTEKSLPVPGFQAGRDYLEYAVSDLHKLLHRLLRTPQGGREAAAVAARAHRKLTRQFDMQVIVSRCAGLFHDQPLD